MAVEAQGTDLLHVVALLGAGVVAVPIFKRLGLGSVLGYLAAGLVIGPFGLNLFSDPQMILHVAELGVVMFFFIIGLEMQPSRLWSLRREIFGIGVAQVTACGALLPAPHSPPASPPSSPSSPEWGSRSPPPRSPLPRSSPPVAGCSTRCSAFSQLPMRAR